MEYTIVFIAGACFGAIIVLLISSLLVNKLKESFRGKESGGSTQLTDQTLNSMKDDLQAVKNLISAFEKERNQKYGELSTQLKQTAEHTWKLQDTTSKLHDTLTNRSVRGQWGERMAEDVLRLIGFKEGYNYVKQKKTDSDSRPDFTFKLPQDLTVNMDVKFPFDNYRKYCGECNGDSERQEYKKQFLRDVRSKLKEVTTRDYINAETVDYVILFIPNEQIYGFVNENDNDFLDDALKSKVIVCSPLTLYAVLAIIRQAVDNFTLKETASEILLLLGGFSKQWCKFVDSFDTLGAKIKDAQEEFNSLTTTRKRMLDVQVRKVERLRKREGFTELSADDGIHEPEGTE